MTLGPTDDTGAGAGTPDTAVAEWTRELLSDDFGVVPPRRSRHDDATADEMNDTTAGVVPDRGGADSGRSERW